ncbi:hypothetical protein FDO65_14715 [Nakamurella flava]|uniref:PE cleavage protein A C-terminal domain-containing protein n=1 Tax=Nakamurella flava TaxID=2576308 RepID=A0A4U6QEU3_9ACTN|nr:hypothetical protein [Nakamurella flava]TKV58764.1 hypothetical protein FDO65_14715 [Nakamurella flava]
MGRRRSKRPLGAAMAVAALLALALVGCSGSTATPGTASTSPSGSTVAGSALSTASAMAATGSPLSVPFSTITVDGTPKITVTVSIGGGDPVPVVLDTGSSGLIVASSAVGPETTSDGTPFTTTFTGGTVQGTVESATVAIGGVSTANPIAIVVADTSGSTTDFFSNGTQGIMGISSANGATFAGQSIFAPNLQLPAPYNAGFALQIGADSPPTGTWTLGPAAVPAGAVTATLTPIEPGGSPPPGYPGFAKSPSLCWTVGGAAQNCGVTDLDIGESAPGLNISTFGSLAFDGKPYLAPGQTVTVAGPTGPPLWSFATGLTKGKDLVQLVQLGPVAQYNTGLPFFYGRTVTWDYTGGQVSIGPAS